MKIIGARWTLRYNVLKIVCECRAVFEHRADRWSVICPSCGRLGSLADIRKEPEEEK